MKIFPEGDLRQRLNHHFHWINRFYYSSLLPSISRNGWHIWVKRIFFFQRQRNKNSPWK